MIRIMNTTVDNDVISELKAIRKDLKYIREHMVDIDTILSPDEEATLKESITEYHQRKTYTLEDVKRDRS
jgi:hypothetical protein